MNGSKESSFEIATIDLSVVEAIRWSWFSSCNRFDSHWRWYNGVAVLSFFLSGSLDLLVC